MKTKYLVLLVTGVLLISVIGCGGQEASSPDPETRIAEAETPPAPAPEQSQEEYEIKQDSSGTKYIVEPGKLVGGGPPKDGIPSIDNPKFVSMEEADRWIKDNELVLAIDYQGVKRVYPLQILVFHEIVNDVIAGDPLLITY